jgi:hypothetical protein
MIRIRYFRTFLLFLTALGLPLLPLESEAHQPGTIRMDLHRAEDSGSLSFAAQLKKRGDTKLEYLVKNEDADADVLLVFPVCSHDGDGREEVKAGTLSNRDAFFEDGDLRGAGYSATRNPKVWMLCQNNKSDIPGVFLLRRGEVLRLKMGLDFRDPRAALGGTDDFKVAVNSYFDIYTVDPEDSDSITQDLLSTKRPKLGLLSAYMKRLDLEQYDARQWFSLYYRLSGNPGVSSKGTYRLTTYEDLFLPAELEKDPDAGSGIVSKSVRGDNSLRFAVDEYQTPRKLVPDWAMDHDPSHAHLSYIPTDSSGPLDEEICLQSGRPDCRDYPSLCGTYQERESSRVASYNVAKAAAYTVTGQFSVKWTDHALHPGWGWRAVAWWNNDGNWKHLASTKVQSDGSYTLSIDESGYTGQNLTVQFRAFNEYFQPQDQNNNLYHWANPEKTNISTSHEEGHRWADADGGNANGIGELYDAAMFLWSEMLWRGEINPMRADPLQIFFPNTWYDCGTPIGTGGGGAPGSCAWTDGRVWLTAAQGILSSVVQHEIAHEINFEFWDNKMPANAGGPHTLCNSFNEGRALTEGYANYVADWLQCAKNAASCNIGVGNAEAPGCSAANAKVEEAWVAATFWDLHDSRADGGDILWYNHDGAVHSLYLANGPANNGDAMGIDDFNAVYQNNCSAGHAQYIDDIFEHNNTD